MRCERCTQLTQDKDFRNSIDENGLEVEVCGWCADDLDGQQVVHQEGDGLF